MNGANPNINNGNSNNGNQNNFGATTLNSTTLGTVTNNNVNQVPNESINPIPMPNPSPNLEAETLNPTPMPNPGASIGVTPTPINNVDNNTNPSAIKQTNAVEPTLSEPTPVARPIPGTENQEGINNLTGNTVGAGNINFMGQNPTKPTNIGVVPPSNDNKKQKKPMNKFIFIIFIIVLMAGVAYGVYFFLNKSNNTVKLTTKELTIGIGEIVPDDVKSYTTSITGNSSICSVDNKDVDSSQIGEYKVTIKCNDKTYETKVIVADKEAPKVSLNVVFRQVGTSVNVESFVKSCTDPSNCKTTFKNPDEINKYLETPGGPYKVEILAEDDNQNQATYTTDFYVTNEDIFLYLDCSSSETEVLNYNAKKVIEDIFPIARTEFAFLNVARRDYVYKFNDEKEYQQIIGNKDNTITFDNVTGLAIYDDTNKTLTISTDLQMEQLKSENNGSFPTNYSDILKLYQEKEYPGSQILNDYPKAETEKNE